MLSAGFSAEGDPDVVGESDHGHSGVTRSGHRAADRRTVGTEAVRPHQASHLKDDDEEHRWTRHLPAGHRFHDSLRR